MPRTTTTKWSTSQARLKVLYTVLQCYYSATTPPELIGDGPTPARPAPPLPLARRPRPRRAQRRRRARGRPRQLVRRHCHPRTTQEGFLGLTRAQQGRREGKGARRRCRGSRPPGASRGSRGAGGAVTSCYEHYKSYCAARAAPCAAAAVLSSSVRSQAPGYVGVDRANCCS